jgi:hypothetical protein
MGRFAVGPHPYDSIVVDTLAAGRPVTGHVLSADAWEATRRLAARGYSDGQIGVLVKRTRRQVKRIRGALGVPAPCRGLGYRNRPVEAPCLPRSAH